MKPLILGLSWLMALTINAGSASTETNSVTTVIVVVGAPGEEEYGKKFEEWAGRWERASHEAGAKFLSIGTDATNAVSDLDCLKRTLADETKETSDDFWLVLIGHGTFDGREAKFNLRGPDLSADDLAGWLKPFHRPLVVIDCASSSGPFLSKLSATNRVIVTSTRSGFEQNYSRFGQFFAEAIADPQADLDKDGQTSLLEAFLAAAHRVTEYYETAGRLATEHALLDDNGDGLGTPADWFRGVKAVKKAQDSALVDGLRAQQIVLVRGEQERKLPPAARARRDEIELSIARLRETKSQLAEEDYYRQLEKLLIEMAGLYEQGTNSR